MTYDQWRLGPSLRFANAASPFSNKNLKDGAVRVEKAEPERLERAKRLAQVKEQFQKKRPFKDAFFVNVRAT